jgi:hypothetical protein
MIIFLIAAKKMGSSPIEQQKENSPMVANICSGSIGIP